MCMKELAAQFANLVNITNWACKNLFGPNPVFGKRGTKPLAHFLRSNLKKIFFKNKLQTDMHD